MVKSVSQTCDTHNCENNMIIVIFFFMFVISHSFSYVNKDSRTVDNVFGKLFVLLVYVHEITFFYFFGFSGLLL